MKLFPTELIEISCLFSSLKMQRGREGVGYFLPYNCPYTIPSLGQQT